MREALPTRVAWRAWWLDARVSDLVHALEKLDKRMLIIVDYLESVYECAPVDMARRFLNDLEELARDTSGRVGVVVCGRMGRLPGLLAKAIEMPDRLDVLEHAPVLSGPNMYPVHCLVPPQAWDDGQ